jgi:glycosyltransferase involved in cell wall biosynthesis
MDSEMIIPLLLYGLITLVFIQLFYHLVYFIRIPLFKRKIKNENEMEGISIVVCAHNEEENLRELLPLLLNQDHPNFEVIIVDDKSSDGSYDFLTEEKLKHPRLRLVVIDSTPDAFNSKKYALTLGIKAAKNDIVLLTDADCRPNSTSWASQMAKTFDAETQIVLGYSHYQKSGGFLGNQIEFETLITGISYISSALAFRPYMGVGRNLAYRKSFFLKNKGFYGMMELTGGDDDLFINKYAKKKFTKVCIGADVVVLSIPKKTWSAYYTQKLRHLAAGKHYKFRDKFRIGLFHISLSLMWLNALVLAFYWDQLLNFQILFGIAVGGFLLRLILLHTFFILAAKRFGVKVAGFFLIFSEIFYLKYYLLVGISAQFSKRIKW